MNKKFIALLTLLFLTLSSTMVSAAAQQEDEDEGDKQAFMSQQTYNRLSRVHKMIDEEAYGDALAELRDLAEDTLDRPYEHAVTLQTFGFVYINQENWRQAAQYLQRALDQDALPKEPEKQVVYALAQIYSQLEEYSKTISLMTDYLQGAENPPPDAFIILANAYAAQNQFTKAYPWVRKATAAMEKPKKDWLNLQLGIQFELKKFSEAADTLEILTANWPDTKRYWQQLSGVYIELGKDNEALATLSMAYKKGFLETESEYLNLARLYMLNDVPYQAGYVVEKAIDDGHIEAKQKNYELLSQAWIQAREYKKGIEALGKAAALTDDGELYLRQAQLFMSIADWEGSMEAAEKAVEKGNMTQKKMGQAWLMRGTAASEAKNFDVAIAAFNKARGYEDTRKQASQWLSFVRTEQEFSTLN
jgi:predicted Zn-dependent protease